MPVAQVAAPSTLTNSGRLEGQRPHDDHTHDRIGLKGSGGSLQCWGYNSDGQIDAPNMAQFNGNLKWQFLQIDVGHRHSCALRYDHKIFCWGNALGYAGMVGPDETIEEKIEFY